MLGKHLWPELLPVVREGAFKCYLKNKGINPVENDLGIDTTRLPLSHGSVERKQPAQGGCHYSAPKGGALGAGVKSLHHPAARAGAVVLEEHVP